MPSVSPPSSSTNSTPSSTPPSSSLSLSSSFSSLLSLSSLSLKDIESLTQRILDSLARQLHSLFDDGLPVAENLALDLLDAMFAPKQILRQIMIILSIQCSLLALNRLYDLAQGVLSYVTEKGRRERELIERLQNAKTYREWQEIARNLDELRGCMKWREQGRSIYYTLLLCQN